MLQRYRYAEMREAVQKVGGAIEWVDYPAVVTVGITLRAGFLSQYGMIRKRFQQDGDNVSFGLAVDIADKVIALFSIDMQGVDPIHVARDYLAGSPRSTDANVEHGVHVMENSKKRWSL